VFEPPDPRLRGRLVARGAAENPAGRFERLRTLPDPELDPPPADDDGEPPPVPTLYLRDPTRTLLAHNESPDLGFDTSLNPYRGCEHGCSYCLEPDTPVLHADFQWRPLGEVRGGDELIGFDEFPAPGRTRKLRPAVVQAVWWSRKPTLRLVTRHAEIVTTAEHRWLHATGSGWSCTHRLSPGQKLSRQLTSPSTPTAGEPASVFGRTPFLEPEPIEAIERGPRRDVVDIQTSTGTFYAAGLATHNCYARPTHEYLGFSAGLDFETRILVKEDAPELLRRALSAPSWQPRVVALSGVTDAYQPVEAKLRLTRRCLEVFAEFRNPVAVVTKSALVARDADLLGELARHGAASVHVSLTTLDDGLRRALEPRASSPRRRLQAIETLARAGVPVGVMCAPVIPGLNDAEIPAILEAAAAAGACRAAHVMLRLPHGTADLFDAWLARHRPERRARVMARVREVRGGRTNDPRFHSRMRGEGVYAEQIHALFELARRRAGLAGERPPLSAAAFRRPGQAQLALF
jgi:DNA repair photolyase